MAQMIELTGHSGLDYLQGLVDRGRNMRPVLAEIGEDQAEAAKRRFVTTTDPDGKAWAPNSPLTLARYGAMFSGKSGPAKLASKKPGTGETRMLATTINYQLYGDDAVGIGSPMVYANTFHYGAQSGEFGFGVYATRNGSFPIPWGNIPSRRFVGVSAADQVNIAELIRSYLLQE